MLCECDLDNHILPAQEDFPASPHPNYRHHHEQSGLSDSLCNSRRVGTLDQDSSSFERSTAMNSDGSRATNVSAAKLTRQSPGSESDKRYRSSPSLHVFDETSTSLGQQEGSGELTIVRALMKGQEAKRAY